MKAEERVKQVYPAAECCVWKGPHGLGKTSYSIYPDARIFRAISGEHESADDAWADAARRIEAAKKGSHG